MSARTLKKQNRHILFNIGMTILFFIFLLSASVFAAVAFRPLYYWLVRLLKIPEETGYSFETCKANYDVLIHYNMFFGPNMLEFPDFRMSIYGAQHFKEVKTIFVALQYTAMGSAALMIPGIVLSRKKWAYGWLKATIIVTLSVIGAVGLAMLINWNWTFTMMHKLLFKNDYWIFDPWQDPVIRILPDGVFLSYGALILLLMGLGLVIAGIVYRQKKGKIAKGAGPRDGRRSAKKG